MAPAISNYLCILGLMSLAWAVYGNEFTLNDCKQMFHNNHPCNKQELLAYRWQTETCDRVQNQNELHTFRTCLGHSGIQIQEICNVCSFFTYHMICGKEKSRRLLRCLGDQFLIQGHGEEIVIAARLCGNIVRSYETSTTPVTTPFQTTTAAPNSWTTLPTTEDDNAPLQPETGSEVQIKHFRTSAQNLTVDSKLTQNNTEIRQQRLPLSEGSPLQQIRSRAEENYRDVYTEGQEKGVEGRDRVQNVQQTVRNVVDQIASVSEHHVPPRYRKEGDQNFHGYPPNSESGNYQQRALYDEDKLSLNVL